MSELEINPSDLANVERIAVPRGENSKKYRQAFMEFSGITIPEPADMRQLITRAGNIDFFWLRSLDIPQVVADGRVDVGITGTDGVLDFDKPEAIRSQRIGETVCRYSLLATPEGDQWLNGVFAVERRYFAPMARIPTSLPRMFDRLARSDDMPFRPYPLRIGGSVEAYAQLLGAPAVADIVQSGETSKLNGLIESRVIRNIGPEAVMRS